MCRGMDHSLVGPPHEISHLATACVARQEYYVYRTPSHFREAGAYLFLWGKIVLWVAIGGIKDEISPVAERQEDWIGLHGLGQPAIPRVEYWPPPASCSIFK